MGSDERQEELLRLADRARDAWAVLRCVTARDGEAALRRHGIDLDPDRLVGTRDGLSEDMLSIEIELRRLADG